MDNIVEQFEVTKVCDPYESKIDIKRTSMNESSGDDSEIDTLSDLMNTLHNQESSSDSDERHYNDFYYSNNRASSSDSSSDSSSSNDSSDCDCEPNIAQANAKFPLYHITNTFTEIHDQEHLHHYLDEALHHNHSSVIPAILTNIVCPNTPFMYKITNPKIIPMMINKWDRCIFDDNFDSEILSVLKSADPIIVTQCLDYLVDPCTTMPLRNIVGSSMLQYGYRNMGTWPSCKQSKDAKHDAIIKLYLKYYRGLKAKFASTDSVQVLKCQHKYILERIKQKPTTSILILKLMVKTFADRNLYFMCDLFKQSCETGAIDAVRCMLELNPDFYAEFDCAPIQYGLKPAAILSLGCTIDELQRENNNLRTIISEYTKICSANTTLSQHRESKHKCDAQLVKQSKLLVEQPKLLVEQSKLPLVIQRLIVHVSIISLVIITLIIHLYA